MENVTTVTGGEIGEMLDLKASLSDGSEIVNLPHPFE
jgi:hypothetical protein